MSPKPKGLELFKPKGLGLFEEFADLDDQLKGALRSLTRALAALRAGARAGSPDPTTSVSDALNTLKKFQKNYRLEVHRGGLRLKRGVIGLLKATEFDLKKANK